MTYELITDLTKEAEDHLLAFLHRNHPNYIISKKDSKVTVEKSFDKYLPENRCFYLCDTKSGICDLQKNGQDIPVIAYEHSFHKKEDLMKAPWLIEGPEALSDEFLEQVFHRHYGLPLTVKETGRCILRELKSDDFPALCLLDGENSGHPDACFFPAGETDESGRHSFLKEYIKNQYPFYGYGIYAVIRKADGFFLGIAGFASGQIIKDRLPVSYCLFKKYRGRGYAKEVVSSFLSLAKDEFGYKGCYAKINPDNIPSIRLIRSLHYVQDLKNKDLWFSG